MRLPQLLRRQAEVARRALRVIVFANLDGLFACHTSAENARYLVPELGGEGDLDITELTALGNTAATRGSRLAGPCLGYHTPLYDTW